MRFKKQTKTPKLPIDIETTCSLWYGWLKKQIVEANESIDYSSENLTSESDFKAELSFSFDPKLILPDPHILGVQMQIRTHNPKMRAFYG